MKKYILSILLGMLTCGVSAQENVTLFFLNDGSFKGFYDEEIDSIAYSHLDLDSIWHNDVVVQEVWLGDSVVRIPVEDIDSICHKVPDPVYKTGVILLDERYLPYILSVNDLTITFSSGLPDDLRPHIGDVLIYEGYSDLFPDGFAGKVMSINGNNVTCEEADVSDVFDKVVFFGSYAVIDRNQDSENAPAYSLRRVRRRSPRHSSDDDTSWFEDAYDWLIESWRMGDGSIDDIGFGTIKDAIKLEFKNIHTTVGFDYKVTPVVSIYYAYDMYRKNQMCFYKRTINYDYTYKFYAKYSRDMKPDDDAKKNLWNSFWKGMEPDWHDMGKVLNNDPNDNDTQSFFLLDKEAPIPDFPLLKVGLKLGVFFQPKLEGELSIGVETKGNFEKTYIYSSNDGGGHDYDGPKSSETSFVLEGSVKGSLWAGGVLGLHADLGFGKGEKLKGISEEITARVGPYIEGEIKADFADAIASKSWYNLVKDSKIKYGWKLGVNFDFKVKFGDAINFNWNQINWTPQHLFGEKNIYFFPKFEAPAYSTIGNSLYCTSKVSRQTLNNKIGFVLLKEDGSEQDRKYLDDTYSFQNDDVKYSDDEHPYIMNLTFDNLDFANHRYTIVPTTRLFGYECLGMQMPDDQRTTVLCPTSNHPHLIDLGLPSGTKWLCSNVYADNPKDAGGYYQWGKSAMVHSYNNLTYQAPNILTSNYQGSEYDAATANLDLPYVTPTLSQFDELFDNCSSDIKYSTWGETIFGSAEGVFLKGRNGNNLYLPFSGFKSGTKVNNDSEQTGFFLTSDVFSGDRTKYGKAFFVKKDGRADTDAEGYGYSVRPVSSVSSGLTFEPQEIDFEDVLIASQSLGTISRSTRITNTGNAPVTMTVMQTATPFTVNAESVGTFTLQPKEAKDIYVSFNPTDITEYTSELTIQYDTDNSCTVSKVPLKGKGIGNGFSLSSNTVSLTEGSQTTVDITSGNGSYTLESSNEEVATATLYESTITISAISVGSDTITVTDDLTDQKAEIVVTVTAKPENPEITPGEAIDLGLPSGTLWATCNVGANSPEEGGLFFAWGETQGYTSDTSDGRSFDWASYKWCNGSYDTITKYCIHSSYGYNGFTDGLTELLPVDDAATANWGSGWRMPTNDQFEELINSEYTTTEWTTVNGVNGRKITSKVNGNSIFLPAAGCRLGTRLSDAGSYGSYWSRSLRTNFSYYARYLCFNSGGVNTDYYDRLYGRSVRPVRAQNAQNNDNAETTTYTVNGVSFKMVAVEGGTFTMGATPEQGDDADSDEKPAHEVTLDSYSIGETEVTQELWEAVMGSNPSKFSGNKRPVEKVSWYDCQTFIEKLNELTGQTFRLPTEAEWEYAARGGNQSQGYKYAGSNTIDDVAWYMSNSSSETHEVGTKQANELGLYDMSGNVWEWCQDWYSSSYYSESVVNNPQGPSSGSVRVRRGGGWGSGATGCRVASRDYFTPEYTFNFDGLRLAL